MLQQREDHDLMPRMIFEKADVIPLVAEVFRELGEGTSLSSITDKTGLSKGSLYHFFPGGKEGMAAEILGHVDAWFVAELYRPLEREEAPPGNCPNVEICRRILPFGEARLSHGRLCDRRYP